MISATGWDFETCCRLRLDDYNRLMRYTADHPPVQVMLQAFLGVKAPERPSARPQRPKKDFDTAWREMEEQFKGVPDIWKH